LFAAKYVPINFQLVNFPSDSQTETLSKHLSKDETDKKLQTKHLFKMSKKQKSTNKKKLYKVLPVPLVALLGPLSSKIFFGEVASNHL